jgi:hypothetical protein
LNLPEYILKAFLVIIVYILCLVNADFAQSKTRSMWVWSSTSSIIEYQSTRETFFNFCSNPPGTNNPNAIENFPRSITLLFISAHGYVVGDSINRAKLHSFLKDAHSRGLKIEYLDGDKTWATTNISSGEKYMDYLIAFNSEAADSNEKFDGVQYDVEPYLNSGWSDPSTRENIWNGFIELLTYCQSKIDSLNDGTYFGVAIPRWYDSTPGWLNNKSGIYYMRQLMDLVDYVAVMDYVDTYSRIISDAGAEILYADQIGKHAVIGVEAQSVDPSTSTFYEEGWGNMESNLYEVDKYFKDHSGYAGIAIHHYDYYKIFPQWGSAGKDITPPELIGSKFIYNSGSSYFQFQIVDICGTGLNADSTIANSKVLNSSAGGVTVEGSWKKDSLNYISFYPQSPVNNNDTYSFTLHAVDSSGNAVDIKNNITAIITSVNDTEKSIIHDFNLLQNFPNPFNPSTKIKFSITSAEYTNLKIYDTLGNEVKTLIDKFLSPGFYEINFNGDKLASGVYFYVLTSGPESIAKKMILLR